MARVEASSRDNHIVDLEERLKDHKDKLLKVEEGQALVATDLSLSKEAEQTAPDSLH